jgi:hypothetical protein
MQFSLRSLLVVIVFASLVLSVVAFFLTRERENEATRFELARRGFFVGGRSDGGLYVGPGDVDMADHDLRELSRILDHMPSGTNITLKIDGMEITDAGLQYLGTVVGLRELRVRNTRVTRAGLARLKAALPECEIKMQAGTSGEDAATENSSEHELMATPT